MNRTLFGVELQQWDVELLATRGERLAVIRHTVRFIEGATGPSEVETMNVEECGPDGRMLAITILDPDDVERAMTVLDARYEELAGG